MHPAAHHGIAGELVEIIGPHTEGDPAALLVSLLVTAGAAFGRKVGAIVEGDWHAPNLFAAIVGESAKARKGTTQGRARQVIELACPEFTDRMTGGMSSGEGLVWQVRDPITKRRRARGAAEREEADAEGYVIDLDDEGVTDKRLLVAEGELAQTLRVMRRESNTLSAVVRNLWDRGEVASLTKNSPARTSGAHVAVIGHITRDELARELTETDAANGFANRFLWCCARRSKVLPDGGALTDTDLAPAASRLRQAIHDAGTPREIVRDDQARDLWHAVYPSLSEGTNGLYGAVTSRAEAQVLRLAVIYALLDRAKAIDVDHLKAALAVWDYCDRSAAHIFGDGGTNPTAERIIRALRSAADDGLSRTAIRDLFGRHEDAAAIDAALAELAAGGFAVSEARPTGGRPAEHWKATAEHEPSTQRPPWTRHLGACDKSDLSDQSHRAS